MASFPSVTTSGPFGAVPVLLVVVYMPFCSCQITRLFEGSYHFSLQHPAWCLIVISLTTFKWSGVPRSCLTLCDPVDCSLLGSSLHEILQAKILEWVAISFSRGSSWPRDRTQISHIAGRRFTLWATREAPVRFKVCPRSSEGASSFRAVA